MIGIPKLRVFVTDDEAPARKKLLRFLADEPDVSVVGEAGNGADAVRLIRESRPELLFLDVQMPGMDGFEVIRTLGADAPTRIVFVTAHDEYAIRAFEVHAFGYLLKPFDQPRFRKVLADVRDRARTDAGRNADARMQELLRQFRSQFHIQPAPEPKLLVEEKDRGILLSLNTVDWVEADRNYLSLHVGDRRYEVRGTIESLEEKLDRDRFLRLNRSSLVRIDFIREFQKWTHGEYRVLLASGKTLTWTRRYLGHHPELLRKL